MRNNTVVNHENEDLMNEILRQMSNIYGYTMNPYMVAKFVGVLLALKKHGAFEDIDCNNPHIALMNLRDINMSDPMITLSQETIAEVMKTTEIEIFIHIINFLAMSEFSEGEYLRWYDYCLDELSTKNNPFAMFSAPQTFATLVDAFLPSENLRIFNPFGGIMRLATDMERYQSMDACEINRDAWALGMLRLELSGNADKVSYVNRNVDSWTTKHYDAIVAMPPFNTKIQMHSTSPFMRYESPEEMEGVAISRFAESTTPDGCCITFVSPSVLWSSGEKARLREWATKKRYIDTIILLPKNMLESTTIPVVCLVLRKNSYHMGGVRMIDASNLFSNHEYKYYLSIGEIMKAYHNDTEKVSATIPFDQIEENDYSWNVTEYLNQQEVECPEGYTLNCIENIIRFPQVKRYTDHHSGKVIQISNLSDDWTRPYVDMEAIVKEGTLHGCAMVTEDAVLLSTMRTLKPSIVKASIDNPVFVHPNIMVAIPNDGIDSEYLCMVLAKVEIPTIGVGVSHISKTRLLRYQIALPSLEQQRSTYQEARHAAMLEQVKSLHLEEVLDRRMAEYVSEIRSRKHDMKPHIRQIMSACSNMSIYLERKSEFSQEEFDAFMQEELLAQSKAIKMLDTLLDVFSREEKFGTPEIVNIEKFLKEYFLPGEDYNSVNKVDYQSIADYGYNVPERFFDENNVESSTTNYVDGLNVFAAKDDLIRLFSNLVENAKQHAFVGHDKQRNFIHTRLSIDQERDMFKIEVINNGNPFPEGMDKLHYGIRGEKAGPHAGTGEGGYIVKSIVEHYEGDYDISSVYFYFYFYDEEGRDSENPDVSIGSAVIIYLPIYHDNE